MSEQISEEFAKNELLKFRPIIAKKIHDVLYSSNRIKDKWGKIKKLLLEEWKKEKHIKQSHEEKLREKINKFHDNLILKLKKVKKEEAIIFGFEFNVLDFCHQVLELIEIQDNQIKELKK